MQHSPERFAMWFTMPEQVSFGCEKWAQRPAVGTKDFDSPGFCAAWSYIRSIAQRTPFCITESDVLQLHSLVSRNQFGQSEYRKENVAMKGDIDHGTPSTFPEYGDVPYLMDKLLSDESIFLLPSPIAAAMFHQRLVDIHPFLNGNGRVARLCMNAFLLNGGFRPLCVTTDWRNDYTHALRQEQLYGFSGGFIELIATKVAEQELKEI